MFKIELYGSVVLPLCYKRKITTLIIAKTNVGFQLNLGNSNCNVEKSKIKIVIFKID